MLLYCYVNNVDINVVCLVGRLATFLRKYEEKTENIVLTKNGICAIIETEIIYCEVSGMILTPQTNFDCLFSDGNALLSTNSTVGWVCAFFT